MYHFLIPCFNLLLRLTNRASYKDFSCSSERDPKLNIRFSSILSLMLGAHKDLCSGRGFTGHTVYDKVTLHSEPWFLHICQTGLLAAPSTPCSRVRLSEGRLQTRRSITSHPARLTSTPLSKVSSGVASSRKLSLRLFPSRSLS